MTALPPALALAGVDLVEGDTPVLRGVDWVVGRRRTLGRRRAERVGQDVAAAARLVPAGADPRDGDRPRRHVRAGRRARGPPPHRLREHRAAPASAALSERPRRRPHGPEAALEPGGTTTPTPITSGPTRFSSSSAAATTLTQDIGSLSEGERKRLLVARVLMADPQLLLFDEPCAGLDLGGRESLVALLGALADAPDARPMVMVTHHLEEIPPGFTHALVLRAGRVVVLRRDRARAHVRDGVGCVRPRRDRRLRRRPLVGAGRAGRVTYRQRTFRWPIMLRCSMAPAETPPPPPPRTGCGASSSTCSTTIRRSATPHPNSWPSGSTTTTGGPAPGPGYPLDTDDELRGKARRVTTTASPSTT